MSDDLVVEGQGETVGEAKWNALRELERLAPGLAREAVELEVVSEGERGLLGVGYEPARVVARASASSAARAYEPAPGEGAAAARVRELVERVAAALGVPCRVTIAEDDETLTATCSGPDLGPLIGRHGQTLDAVQCLGNAIAFRGDPEGRKAVVVDAAGYRERRREQLEALASRTAERVVATGERAELEPMSAIERKVVHLHLQDYPGVATTSEGAEPGRYVVVNPA